MTNFTFKEDDREGLQTLEAVGAAVHFNQWMFEQVNPHMSGSILEIGSGIGNISSFFIQHGAEITLSDIREAYCNALKQKFSAQTIVKVRNIDLVHPDFDKQYSDLLESFDSAFALNVIEHIEDDRLAMKNLVSLLKPEGKVLILVPAWSWLYNDIDKSLYHFRRYTPKSLRTLFLDSKLHIKNEWMFNALGIPAWFTGGKIMKKREIEGPQMNSYDKLVPLARILDSLTFNRIGLSVIAVGSKG